MCFLQILLHSWWRIVFVCPAWANSSGRSIGMGANPIKYPSNSCTGRPYRCRKVRSQLLGNRQARRYAAAFSAQKELSTRPHPPRVVWPMLHFPRRKISPSARSAARVKSGQRGGRRGTASRYPARTIAPRNHFRAARRRVPAKIRAAGGSTCRTWFPETRPNFTRRKIKPFLPSCRSARYQSNTRTIRPLALPDTA